MTKPYKFSQLIKKKKSRVTLIANEIGVRIFLHVIEMRCLTCYFLWKLLARMFSYLCSSIFMYLRTGRNEDHKFEKYINRFRVIKQLFNMKSYQKKYACCCYTRSTNTLVQLVLNQKMCLGIIVFYDSEGFL